MSPNLPDYYALLGLDERYHLDPRRLREAYLQHARAHHPDHNAQTADTANQSTALVNQAYQTLLDPHARLAYLLQRYGYLDASGKAEAQLPQAFLMEMLELNEAVDELTAKTDAETVRRLQTEIDARQAELQAELAQTLAAFDGSAATDRAASLAPVLTGYLQQRYLLRLAEKLRSFAR
ncbi:MAG: Fe-S protein assembly co-chaperone HscB [Bacteroidia bacterium]|nr:Fe-S protein assembly co-chaperone HscB [Bacteroidia bacterium]